ncbi:nonribosomal peptide synthetase-like protein 2 [Karstenula rhodostoma CBS 690.94]|uniref:Nonribosomal peptide synthetase-like protein 2 n=1 Tax=Karstenula rhodostoma CBS 690.94 TaxID=1392251 RepID=A0A9P4PKV0_9PLEO|nr:nonribosomal peptide synthetase-like protein 2 [Karstenula rhodostoma CBS 690.94]
MLLQEPASVSELSVLNRQPKTLPGPEYLHHLVRPSSATDGPAIDFLENGVKRRKLTYEELHTASDGLARKIEAHLARLENASDVVPVLLPQSPELYIALLAILKSGRAFCPIGLDAPPERVDFILRDVSADIFITNSTLKDSLPSSRDARALLVDRDDQVHTSDAGSDTRHQRQSRLAYVLYTSGSTGLPKAVSVSHRAVTQSLLAHDRHIPPFSRFLQFAAPTFDVSIFEIFFPFYRGATLSGCTRTHMVNDLPATIASLQVDAAELTPTAVSNLLRGRKSVPGLKLLLTIGEMLTRDVVDEYGGTETRPSILWGMYGPTEAAIHCTLQPSFSCTSPSANIGFPLDTVTAIIAAPVHQGDPMQGVKVLPLGEVGELVIGGPQVADEYLNRPELTVASFVHDATFGYLYRTGDKARLCSDGTLECLGRMVSGQVKLRGQRVELSEIEQTIIKVDGCYSAVAMVIEDALIAFCATHPSTVSSMIMQKTCRQWLPSYMVPTEFISVDRMPQLPSGKVDRKALEAIYLDKGFRPTSPEPQPSSMSNDPFTSIFHTVLGRAIADSDDFASVGLDSLRSIRIASALREIGLDVGSIDILTTNTLNELRDLCEGREKRTPTFTTQTNVDANRLSNFPELQPYRDDIADMLPCTPLQEAMLTETATKPSAYCNWIEVELSEPHSFSQIREMLRTIVQHNEILRTGFYMASTTSTSFVQLVWKNMQSSTVIEVSTLSRSYSLGSEQSLLRPFTVQVITATGRPRLLFQIHHALYDGWSFDLLLRDLNELLAGRSSIARPQFREVVDYYLQLSISGNLEKSAEYWRSVLHEFSPTPLPNFNGRTLPYSGLSVLQGEHTLDMEALSAVAKEHAIHPQVFYQAAVSHIIGQYLGTSDVVIGTVTSGRTIPVTHIEEVMGPCIATLPFRANLACSTVGDLLKKTQRANRDMLQHCTLPLRDITRFCQLRPGEHLFDVLFIWQESHVSAENRKLALRMTDSADDLEYTITIEVEPRDVSVAYRITYDASTIPEKQIEYLATQIQQTIQYFLANHDGELEGARSLLDEQELSIANPTPGLEPIRNGPAHCVEVQAVETPAKDAVVIGSIVDGSMKIVERLSYASLNARANQLAHALVALGAGNDQLICVMLEKSVDLYVSILAILKTGCGYLPVVPDTPTERLDRILADAGVNICISKLEYTKKVRRDALLVLDPSEPELARYPDHNFTITYNGEYLAYAVFTSGSTGKPKGVLVTQDNLMNNLEYLSTLYPYTENSRLLQSCSQAFDVSVFEIFFSWYVGMCLCTAPKDDLFYDFEAAIDSLDITHLSLTPTVAGLVHPSRVPKVKFLVTAGEAITEGVKRRWAGKGLYQGYGPSETTNICTVRSCVTETDLINNIGPVFPNTSLLILGPGTDSVVPRGAVGELCFGGAQVFRGYLNRPDLNAEKIIAHPKYGRIYRSGDMGRLLPDDSIFSMGRLDDQVKIRGQRVELGEITSVVLDCPHIIDCATVLTEDDMAIPQGPNNVSKPRQQLVVFWVPAGDVPTEFCSLAPKAYQIQTSEIFDSLTLQLPAYMIPTHIVPISRIPMTPQAKIDKPLLHRTFQRLESEDLELTSRGSGPYQHEQMLNATEKTTAEALSRTMDLPLVGIKRNSSFFNLGLDSVSAIRFAKNLRDAGFEHIPVSIILKNPTVERLSSVLSETSASKVVTLDTELGQNSNVFDSSQLSSIRSEFAADCENIDKILPCTPLQEAMLSSGPSYPEASNHDRQHSEETASYYNVMAFAVNGSLEHLKKSWEHMVHRHDILRTTFVATDNAQHAFAQVILRKKIVSWDEIDPSTDLRVYARNVLSDLLQSHEPPVRLAIQGHGTSARLIFCCHHALYDGLAIATLLDEIQDFYLKRELPVPVPYESYLRHMSSPDLGEALQFWRAALANFEPTYFPNLSSKLLHLSHTASSVRHHIQIPLSVVTQHCRKTSISLLALVQSAWAKLLHFVLADTDLCFGNVVSGRTLPEDGLDRLVAPCFNTLPVRLNFDFQRSNIELCKELHAFNVDALPFQLTPLRWIQSKTRQEQGRLFDTLVILQQPHTPLDNSIWTLELDDGDVDLPVVCEVAQDKISDTLTLNLHYQLGLCQKEDAETLAAVFDHALQSLVRYPDSAAEDTIGLPDRFLGQSNMSFQQFDTSKGGLLHSAFEQNVLERPGSIALYFQDTSGMKTSLTFLTLNEKANQIAHALLHLGIKPDDVVPIHMPKSLEFYISILGVLKAGAAFSPIHPNLPEARKQFMISELGPKVVLSPDNAIGRLHDADIVVINVTETENFPTENPSVNALRPTNMAYCLYTSGSTGRPKAVSMEHRAPIQTIESSRSLIPWTHDSRLLQYAAITFDMCYYDCFLAWSFGFTLCAADQDAMLDNLTDSINALDADLLDLTPSVALSLRKVEVPNVKWLYCIGEAMTPEVVTEWAGACVNSYGPTEAAFCTTIFPTTPEVKTSVIGRPFPTTSFAVFSPRGGRPLPVLGVGELYIGGAQLARGYYGQAQLTEKTFSHKCGQKFYKSGDVVRMLSDGNFEFIGRTDDQVKIRGLRVELGEINKTLKDSDGIIVAVTTQILKKEGGQKDQLVAFLVLQSPANESEQARLRSAAKQKAMDTLPSYMVPQFFLFIDKIPKSMAGKIDKKALASVFRGSIHTDTESHDAEQHALSHEWTEQENRIRDIFSKLSNTPHEEIKPWTSIYQLGLDSISAVQIAVALRKDGLQASATDVMRFNNCKDLAAHLERSLDTEPAKPGRFDFDAFERKHRDDIAKICGIPDEQIETIRPCTPLQNGMLSQFIAKEGDIYFNYLRLCLNESVDARRLSDAWLATVAKHRMLRTGFVHVKDSNTSFAMIHYVPSSASSSEQIGADDSRTTEQWLHDSAEEAVKSLHHLPWRVRINSLNGVDHLDMALLHAIFDAQSLQLIFNDVVAAYQGKSTTTAPFDAIIDDILYLSRKDNTASNEFWKQLGQVAAPTRFPNLSPLRYNPTAPDVLAKPSKHTMEELNGGCRVSNITLQAAGLASWATLLSSYVGEPSVTFGVVLSGRTTEGADAAVFPCITTVPFVCRVSDDQAAVLKNIMSLNAEIQQHQFTPLNSIQKLMGYPNEPLFDSIFAFQKLGAGEPNELWTVVDEQASTEYPLSIELEPKDGRLVIRLTFLPHVVPKEQASLILDQLDYLIERHVFSRQGRRPSSTEFHPAIYSVTSAATPTIPSEVSLLHEFVELTAAKTPNRIAFEFASSLQHGSYASRKWTYTQLDCEGNRIANLLISHAVRPGELVGVCFDKCPEASFAILGILKAGCAFVALDPGAPSARKAFILKDSGAPIVLSMSAQTAGFKEETKATVLNLDEIDWQSASAEKPVLERAINPQDRSYCLYTSGTTGTPKGCELTHENAVQAMLAFSRLFWGHWNDESRWLQFASFHFDVSVLEQYWSWSVGICVVSAPRDLIFEDLAGSIRALQVTHIDLTPSLARILHPGDVPTLCKGVFITGGESLKQEILDVWGPKSVIYNGYGPTEATIGVTMYPRVPANGKPSNIGPQFGNVGSYVLRSGSDVPVLRGGVGELCVSGKLVGKGYLNRPELTEERFPHLERFGERVYRTGDLVRILHDGTFDFLGRADDQVKLRGQRLEIGEINSVIKQCGIAIADVATLVLKHPKQQKEQLVSFVVVGSGTRGDTKVVLQETGELWKAKEACQEKLPPYMVPTHFVALTTMPLSANNKAESRKLKEVYDALSVSELQHFSSGTPTKDGKWSRQEEKVRHILKEAMGTVGDDFSKDVSFFELGMDSISVIGVSRALKQAGYTHATASIILKNSTIRRLTKALSNVLSEAYDRGSVTEAQQAITAVQHRYRRVVAETLFMDTRNIETLAPCTPLQQGMIVRALESDNAVYFNSFRFELGKDVDADKLRDAWGRVFASTQILRTVFMNTDEGFVQAVLRNVELPGCAHALPDDISLEDYLATKKVEWVRLNRTNFKRPFEILVVTTSTVRHLVVHIFHALYDGNSIAIVFKAVWDAYHDRKIQIGSAFHSALAHGPLRPTVDARQFWEEHLQYPSFRPLPTLNDRIGEGPVALSREVRDLRGFEATRRTLNITAQAIAQACWTSVLHQYLKAPVTIGMVMSGRNIDFDGADKVIGPLFNTIPYRYRARQRETWASLVTQAHEFNISAQSYQHTPLRDIMKWLKRGPGQPLFDTLFVYQVVEEDEQAVKNDLWQLRDSGAEADYPLAIEVEQSADGALILTLVAQGHVANLDLASELLEKYERSLRNAIEDPDAVLETFVGGDGDRANGFQVSPMENTVESLDGTTDFKWSSHANTIRKEVADLSGVDVGEVNANTSIFELGLDSIDAIKLSSKLKKHGIELPVSGIMRGLNISNMMQYISVGKEKAKQRPSDMIYQANKKRLENYLRRRGLTEGVEQILPPTPLQGAMVAEMIASEYTRYYNHDVLEIRPGIDLERVRQAWAEVIRESAILRTTFIAVDDPSIDCSHAQVVHHQPHDFWKSTVVDNEPDFPAIFDSIRDEATGELSSHPLFHVHLIQSPRQAYLVLSVAHALYDGWSLSLLHSDIHRAYAGIFHPRPSYEPALHEILTATGADAAAFWRDYLSDAKQAILSRRANPAVQTVHRKEQRSRLALETITPFARKHGVTLQTLGQAVHGATIASYTKSLDVTFGSVLSGRDDELKANLLFPTMNTVAIRIILHSSRQSVLQYVQANFSSIKQWQHFPLRKALSLAGVHGAVVQSLFIYQKSLSEEGEESEKLYKSVQGRSDVEYPVCVEMEVVGTELIWRCAVKDEIFDDAGAQELLDRLDGVLEAIVAQPDAPVVDFKANGISICGLPAYTTDEAETNAQLQSETEQQRSDYSATPTAGIIREVLAFVSQTPDEEITAGMTIFHIGLDSISAIKVASLLRKRGIVLSVGEMMRAGTVEEMARIVDERTPTADSENKNIDGILEEALSGIDRASVLARAGIKEEDMERVLPATAGQIYMLSTWVNSNGAMFYPEFNHRIHGEVSLETIETAWSTVVSQNAILRTHLIATKDKRTPYIQLTMRNTEASVIIGNDMTEDELADQKVKMASRQPYAHLVVSRLSQSSPWNLQLKIHHALYDGVSLPLIIRQLQDLCNSVDTTAPTDMLPLVIAKTSDSSSTEQRKIFWTDYLKDLSPIHLAQPSAPPTSRTEIFKPGLLPSVAALEKQAHKHGLTTQSLFLATYAKLYARLTSKSSSSDIVIGLYLANRSLPIANLHEAAIPTVNLVPLRVSTPQESHVLDVAAQVQYDIQEISAPANASAGLWEIAEWTGVRVDTFVNFLKFPGGGEDGGEGPNRITSVEEWSGELSRVVEVEVDRGVVPPRELVDGAVNAAYLHALDIEATIRDGALDVGVFAPRGMMELEEGEKLMEEIRVELEGVGKTAI